MGFDFLGSLQNALRNTAAIHSNVVRTIQSAPAQVVRTVASAPAAVQRYVAQAPATIVRATLPVTRSVDSSISYVRSNIPTVTMPVASQLNVSRAANTVTMPFTSAITQVKAPVLPKQQPLQPQLQLQAITKVATNTFDLITNKKWGTDYSDRTVDPWGKAIAVQGAALPQITQPIRDVYLDQVWNRYKTAETIVGQGLRNSPIPGSQETLELARTARDLVGLDNPETAFSEILGTSAATKVTVRGAKLITQGGEKVVSAKGISRIGDLLGDVGKRIDNLRNPAKKYGKQSVPKPKAKAPVQKPPTPKPSRVAKQPIRQVTPRSPTGRAVMQQTTTTRYKNLVETTPKPRTVNKVVDASTEARHLEATPALRSADDVIAARKLDNAENLRQADVQPLRTADDIRPTGWSGGKIAAASLGAGAAGAVGTMTLAGLLFPKDAEVLTPDEVERPLTPGPQAGGESWADDYGGEWWQDPSGLTQWDPSPEQIEQCPTSIQDDLENGGHVVFDSDGNPWGLADENGNIIREFTEEEKEAMRAVVDENMPLALKAKLFISNNPLLVGGLVVTAIAGGVVLYYKYAEKKNERGRNSPSYNSKRKRGMEL